MKKAEKEFKALGIVGAVNFPVVLKSVHNNVAYITVVYRNRTELYKIQSRYNETIAKEAGSKFDSYAEIEMELGNGAKIIRGGDY